ncbi:hypothetical protein J1G43_17005 [Cellulomonas sp. zg-ZUI22]|uniref:hypothetical protein n=1 Tax=Cellulomonas sp. zg-ZUI22 TaxID=2816955 RepID=UPI001A9513A6|nr:hypothetical protein [Cellulomonas sp. zg-ZUI22]MBO0901662.1 hypothetical protein [Cellulomonas sp. zg-ZUI22]
MDTLATSDLQAPFDDDVYGHLEPLSPEVEAYAGLVRAGRALSEESSRHVADKLRPARGEHVVARLYRPAAVPGR